jgi:hypothetical protein
MIPDRLTQLLTAYVDGELSARQRRAVQRLLHRSPEARELLGRLQADARSLRQLPHHRPAKDLTFPIMRAIAAQGVHPSERPAVASGLPAWTGLAVAASVLLVISCASYFYFSASHSWSGRPELARHDEVSTRHQPGLGPDKNLANRPGPGEGAQPVDRPQPEQPEAPPPTEVARDTEPRPDKPDLNGNRPEDILGSHGPFDPRIDFAVPRPRLSAHVLRDLDQAEPLAKLQAELQKDPGYRLELFCLDSTRALERLQAGFKAINVRLQLDADAQLRLKHKLPTAYVLFLEDLTPEELARALQLLGAEDRKQAARRTEDGVFGKLLVNPLAASDEKELARLLGIDPAQLAPRKKAELDLRKPISSLTEEEVIQSLAGQGVPRPGTTPKSVERVGLVISAARRPGPSRETQQFLDTRREPRPGTVQVLLVLRLPNI